MELNINTNGFKNGDLVVYENGKFVKTSLKELLHKNGITQRIGKLESTLKELYDLYSTQSELYKECLKSNEKLMRSMIAHNIKIIDDNGGN